MKQKMLLRPFEHVIVPLCGEESVLLHVDVFRNKDNRWCLGKTFATLQLKNKNAVIWYFNQEIEFILDCDGFVTNGLNDNNNITCMAGEKRLKILLYFWLRRIKFLDSCINQKYKELEGNCLFYCNRYTYQERIVNNERLLPNLPLYKSPEKMVYLIGDRKNGLIKIGVSQDVGQRLSNLQSIEKTPLEIIATKQGSFDTEKELHRQFSQLRQRGEWFTWDDSIIAAFNQPTNQR